MARTRSPAYPAIPLREAIEHAQRIFDGDHRHAIPRDVAVQHMGYKSLHGNASSALSAIGKYGLLETASGKVRISDLAMDILFEPEDSEKRRAALRTAAGSPKLFAALQSQFGVSALPSDQALRAYLLKENFNSTAVGDVIRSYRDTMELISEQAGGYDTPATDQSLPDSDQAPVGDVGVLGDDKKGGVEMKRVIVQGRAAQATPPTPHLEVGFQPHRARHQGGEGMKEDVFALTEGDVILQWPESLSQESFEDLKAWADIVLRKIERKVTMNKLMHEPVYGAMATEYSDDEDGRAAQKRDQELE